MGVVGQGMVTQRLLPVIWYDGAIGKTVDMAHGILAIDFDTPSADAGSGQLQLPQGRDSDGAAAPRTPSGAVRMMVLIQLPLQLLDVVMPTFCQPLKLFDALLQVGDPFRGISTVRIRFPRRRRDSILTEHGGVGVSPAERMNDGLETTDLVVFLLELPGIAAHFHLLQRGGRLLPLLFQLQSGPLDLPA
ncbi:hypothetical protein Egran_06286 [Elaphomyces granulatus]|uniref:Uncharacterized protein n=1 Tax=Elaphomyces granulatus TaxID=519963 RepID=A0A232LQ63_9EURO|nr:hypothetical protein Egran_06286 [Elaphomyces granulatus]